ncbi:MAG: hypothetical protein K0Q53_1785 [Massilibacillus sp.]|jgi:hypothetical protein|nr:hypothetical protein [Massilibacillus sp.]
MDNYLRSKGFKIMDTVGNCQAYFYTFKNGKSIRLTDKGGTGLPNDNEEMYVGLYAVDGSFITDLQCATIKQLDDIIKCEGVLLHDNSELENALENALHHLSVAEDLSSNNAGLNEDILKTHEQVHLILDKLNNKKGSS